MVRETALRASTRNSKTNGRCDVTILRCACHGFEMELAFKDVSLLRS